jgi:poly(A) polymerase/tRNA nucleotidyltransferase (CCA-adding enzyme)
MKAEFSIPSILLETAQTLENKGFKAYLVGGCVRDLAMNREPKDWDFTTSAKPEEIEATFPKTFYENRFGTVTVVNEEEGETSSLRHIEITPFRKEGEYSDQRHPDEMSFSATLEEDLARRDFTINALAYRPTTGEFIDLYEGLSDIKQGSIKSVGKADERFKEDALRILRGIRLATELGFMINQATAQSMAQNSHLSANVSRERVRDEFTRIMMSKEPMRGLKLLVELEVMPYVIRETLDAVGVEQNGDHIYDVWEHTMRVAQHSADRDWPLHVRLAALFHDIGKPKTRRWSEEKKDYTFYGHEVVGARMAKSIMENLKFPVKLTETVVKLVRNHMFFSDIDKITLSAVRRIVANVGQDNVWDLMKLRACDRIGMGRPKEAPYRLRKYEAMIEEAMRAPTSVGMLKTDGQRLMDITGERPGPKIGHTLHTLLQEVLDKPELNNQEYLDTRAKELMALNIAELIKLGEKGKEAKEERETEEITKIRKKHGVK